MTQTDITHVLQKADELRALFILGQRVIPFLEEIFVFVSEIQPLLDEMNVSIKENLRKMPNASKQLSKVTEATERSTTEIMDIVDGLVYKSEIISANITKLYEINQNSLSKPVQLLELIHKGIQQGTDLKSILPELSATINLLKTKLDNEADSIVSNTKDILSSILMDSSSIMMSLQVQDITSQQIAAVNNLLETVHQKLGKILDHFNSSDVSGLVNPEGIDKKYRANVSKLHRQIAFDPDAVDAMSNQKERQMQVDSLVDMHNKSADLDEPATLDDIDALFSGNVSVEDLTEPASVDDIDALFSGNVSVEDLNEPASIDDIDALFSGAAAIPEDLTEPVSADDIDALFNATLTSKPSEERESPEIEDDPFATFSQDDIDAMFGK